MRKESKRIESKMHKTTCFWGSHYKFIFPVGCRYSCEDFLITILQHTFFRFKKKTIF